MKIAELGRSIVGNEVEFLDSVGRWSVSQKVIRDLVVIHAIEDKVVGLLAVSIDIRPTTAGGVVTIVKTRRTWRYGTRCKQGQLDIVARGQRQRVIRS